MFNDHCCHTQPLKLLNFSKLWSKLYFGPFVLPIPRYPRNGWEKKILALSLFLLNERNEWEKNTKEKTIIDFFFFLA